MLSKQLFSMRCLVLAASFLASYNIYAATCTGKVSAMHVDSANSLLITAGTSDGSFAYTNVRICSDSPTCRTYTAMMMTALTTGTNVQLTVSGGNGANLCKDIAAWGSFADKNAWLVGVTLQK